MSKEIKEIEKVEKSEKIKEPFRELVSVEIYKTDDSIEEFQEKEKSIQSHYEIIEDLQNRYLVKIRYIKNEEKIDLGVINPDEVHPLDQFELNESISFILSTLGFKGTPARSEDDLLDEFNEKLMKKHAEVVKEKVVKPNLSKEKDKKGDSNADNDSA